MKALLYILIVLNFLFAGCAAKQEELVAEKPVAAGNSITLTPQAIKNAGIVLGTAEYKLIVQTLAANGLVEVPPRSLVSISFPLGGFLKSTELLPGMPVRKGQVIAYMEDEMYVQLQQDYLQALSTLKLLKLDYDRQRDLSDIEASSKKGFEQARTMLEIQEILVKSLSEKLKIVKVDPSRLSLEKISRTLPIYSPIDGYVKAVYVNIGKYVNPADVLFEIVDPRDIHGAIIVFEKDLNKVKEGQQLKVFSASHPDRTYEGEVILVSRNIDENRGATVHCHFHGDHADLLPGMYISAKLELDQQEWPTVPESAVVRHDGKNYIFLAKGPDSFSMLMVQLGDLNGGMLALTGSEADWKQQSLVLEGAYALLGKMMNVEAE
jgi:cobalt-zinc-cadmium efflux system membrane fusion protein